MKRAARAFTSMPVVTVLRWALGILFIYSGLGKVFDPAQFASAVANYRVLPIATVNIFAIVLPWIELLCGMSLLHKFAHRSSALLICALNVMFIIAAACAMARGLDIECGCKTLSASGKVGWGLIGRDSILLVASLKVLMQPDNTKVRKPSLADAKNSSVDEDLERASVL